LKGHIYRFPVISISVHRSLESTQLSKVDFEWILSTSRLPDRHDRHDSTSPSIDPLDQFQGLPVCHCRAKCDVEV